MLHLPHPFMSNDLSFKPIFQTLFPENIRGGQCITFAHKLIQFRSIGDSLQSKVQNVYWHGIMAKNLNGDFHIGDLVITRESNRFGHGGIINTIWGNELQLTESNFFGNERVHHGRLLNKYSQLIVGVMRGAPKYNMFIGRINQREEVSLLASKKALSQPYRKILGSEKVYIKFGSPYIHRIPDEEYNKIPVEGIINDVM